jgi:hypothetical protein
MGSKSCLLQALHQLFGKVLGNARMAHHQRLAGKSSGSHLRSQVDEVVAPRAFWRLDDDVVGAVGKLDRNQTGIHGRGIQGGTLCYFTFSHLQVRTGSGFNL